ncbi:hypothetical protein EIP91_008820 [Steccherinum ochraceum]|uniref:Protein kinase domain-containing protein n=1 Tax=Steccherinum ochraceum TaxID=92696 RepID=A0A4R0R4L7_9APHY|nr:hypothetical protein EIP91_008820 [Steccherinum ochraceum]
MAPVDTTQRLKALRKLMVDPECNLSALVIPTDDQRKCMLFESTEGCDERRAYISGFTGSAGCAVVTLKDAFLFTDGRYHLQASQQLDQNWTLMKQDVPTWQEFLSKNLENKSRIGIDPTTFIASDADSLQTSLQPKDSVLVSLNTNLVDRVWPDRPSRPANEVFHLDQKYSGQSHQDKIAAVRQELKEKNFKAIVVSMLDEVAWILNLRGSDIDFNPVFFAYVIVTDDRAILFVNPAQVNGAVRNALGDDIDIQPYDEFFPYLKGLSVELGFSNENRVLLSDKTSLAVAETVGRDNATILRSPVADFKSIKNPTEIQGFRDSHTRDGSALVRYFAWLDEQLQNQVDLDECQAADQLEEYRKALDDFKGLSFPTISSSGPNGAIIHYQPERDSCRKVDRNEIYLCDSGAQFLNGTTDTTRTWHFGTPKPEERRAFTRVLQGHIAIDTAIIPNGTSGYIIDSFARRPLWQDGLDYRHGTGHGVGHFLNVHEGPQGIGMRIAYNSTPLKAGMTVSNEPGYYKDGEFGIRIENVVIVRNVETPHNFGNKGYLGFEHVTMCPIDKNLVDAKLLATWELEWLNEYHAEVQREVFAFDNIGTDSFRVAKYAGGFTAKVRLLGLVSPGHSSILRFTSLGLFLRTLRSALWLPRMRPWRTVKPYVFTEPVPIIDSVEPMEEERMTTYKMGLYYPVRIGEVLNQRYQVMQKMGFGANSTVWLCHDLWNDRCVTIKVNVHYRVKFREIEVLQLLAAHKSSHEGKSHIKTMPEAFTLHSSIGEHHCTVHKPLLLSILDFRTLFPDRQLNILLVRLAVSQMLKALDYLHSEVGVIHADIQGHNMMLDCSDENVFRAWADTEKTDPTLRKITSNGDVIYQSRSIALPPGFKAWGYLLLSDFGEARVGPQHEGVIQPDLYRAPEVMFGLKWDSKADIWNLALAAWDICESNRLFSNKPENGVEDVAYQLAQMIAILGPPPLKLLQRSPQSLTWWDESGNWRGAFNIPSELTFQSSETRLEGEPKQDMLRFFKRMLAWDPEDRPSAKELLKDPWLDFGDRNS